MPPSAKKRIQETIPIPNKIEQAGLGKGIKIRLDNPRQVDYRDASRLDGFLLQLTENGRVMELDNTDRAYRLLIWQKLGLQGQPKSWSIIFSLIRFMPRKLVAHLLYTAAADWLVLKNESVKLAFTALNNQKFTISQVQQIMAQLEAKMLISRLEINALRIEQWQHFLDYVEVGIDIDTEVARVQEKQKEV